MNIRFTSLHIIIEILHVSFCFTVLGVDTLNKRNFTGKSIPKYDNIVKNNMFDEQTSIFLPQSAIKEAPYTGELIGVTVS